MGKSYTPWHERIDELRIKMLTEKFVNDMLTKGIVLDGLKVTWLADGNFDVAALCRVIRSIDDESVH